MGAYSPAPVVTQQIHDRAMEEVILPTLKGMQEEGSPYRGFLYAGLMVSPYGEIRVVEFNCRFGDPEAQPIMMRLRSDLLPALQQAAAGSLQTDSLAFDPRTALGVVMAAGGYPSSYETGDPITGLDKNLEDTKVFHAGTRKENDAVITAGGRVLCVVGLGDTAAMAQFRAYERIESIGWRGRYFRKDIGYRAVTRENEVSHG